MQRKPLMVALAIAFSTSSVWANPDTPNEAKQAGPEKAPATAPAKPPAAKPGEPKPFAEIIKDFKSSEGLFPIWTKDAKTYIEIPESWLNKPFLFTINVAESIGERGLYASQMGMKQMVQWEKHGEQIQLVALNTKFRAQGEGRLAASQAFSPSLLAYGKLASAPHPERKSLLIDANGLLMRDILGLSTRLEMSFRLPFSLDAGNSRFAATRSDAQLSTLTARMHFATPRIPAPPPVFTPGAPRPSPPEATPDPRSMFFSLVYSFRALPEQAMRPRLADPRLGHFAESFTDLTDDTRPNTRVHHIKRWRLEKADPAAALSEPKQPIVFWLDKNIPAKVRPAVRDGILEWNKAFERIGYKNAVVVKQQPDDATWDNMDAGHASVRWFVGSDVGFAIGPSHADPRTGEILDADMGMSDVFGRGIRRLVSDDVAKDDTIGSPFTKTVFDLSSLHTHHEACTYAHEAAHEMSFALDLLEARGLDPNGPEADRLVLEAIKDTMMHETGHVLGLKHNFKASTTVTQAQLKDGAFTLAKGTSGSVMDYNALNLPLDQESKSTFSNLTLGPYDYWAIEYAYTSVDPSKEAETLSKIASRSQEPGLAYSDDMDAGRGPNGGFDPMSNLFDLGEDPLAWYQRRLQLSKELWQRVQNQPVQAGEDPLKRRRSLMSGFRLLRSLPTDAAKYVGGVYALRDLPGSTRPNFKPVESAKQREALEFLTREIFSARSFDFKPQFLANLAPDYNEWDRGGPVDIPSMVLSLQTRSLDRLMSGDTAKRVLDLPLLVSTAERKDIISLPEVYGSLRQAIWSELKTGSSISSMRRNLQREHIKRLQLILTRGMSPGGGSMTVERDYSVSMPPSPMPADAISLTRVQAKRLQRDIRSALGKPGLDFESRAHLAETLDSLTAMLNAQMSRS
jgi:hypothetical protein